MKMAAVTKLVTLLLMGIASSVVAAPLLDAANGHYYNLVSPTNGITWTAASAAASASTFNGVNGHLATFSNAAEFNFVTTAFPQSFTWIGFSDQAVEGSFVWVTNEPVTYTGWLLNEPNNAASGNGEDFAWYELRNGVWGWNDYQDVANIVATSIPTSYIVEYDVPEPASLSCLTCGVIVLLSRRRLRARYF
jgi:hypothetical protein